MDAGVQVASREGDGKPFFDSHAGTLHELFVALGREDEWRDSPEDLLPYTQAQWVGQEHGNSVEKDQFTQAEEAAAKEIMPCLGLQQEILPPSGTYEQLVVVGGFMRVNRERLRFAKGLIDGHGVEVGRMVFWAGQRLRESRDDDQLESMDLEALSADRWVHDELSLPAGHGWGSRFATETELTRLAYQEAFPGSELVHAQLDMHPPYLEGIPARDIANYTFAAGGDYPDFTLLNCAAVERPNGPPRPITARSAREWLELTPPSEKAGVLIVAGNPHIPRNLRDIERVANRLGREDVTFDICGPAANPEASIQLYLGEIGRLLYMDAAARQESPATQAA